MARPALLVDIESKHLHKLTEYPRYRHDKWNWIYFQGEESKCDFLSKFNKLKEGSFEACYLTGLTIGYPPKSEEFFPAVVNE